MIMVILYLYMMIVNYVRYVDSNLLLLYDEVCLFEDEGLDLDVDDLSEIESGDDGDWDRLDDDDWNKWFIIFIC